MEQQHNPFSLDGKTIFISGASSGIGRAIAIECSRMGAKTILNGRNQQKLHETLALLEGEGHQILPADITDENQLSEAVDSISNIDGVVLCVGVSGLVALQFATKKKFGKIFDTNFFANTELVRLLIKKKKINSEGSILAIASIGGVADYTNGKAIYGSTKAALASYMKYVAKDVATKKIRANCICPGMIMTAMEESISYAQEDIEKDILTYPLGRYGKPEEVAYIAVYFLSDASKWVTGTNFIIDGGHTI